MRYRQLEHRFAQHIADALEPGVLYISMEYGTAAHSCCCGCGEEVVTPFTPTDWKMAFDGETVSLWPSVGNWNLACRSHYVIDHGQVVEAGRWSDKQVLAERRRDKAAKASYYGTPKSSRPTELSPPPTTPAENPAGLGQRVIRWMLSRAGRTK
jgi:hypothetical protein